LPWREAFDELGSIQRQAIRILCFCREWKWDMYKSTNVHHLSNIYIYII
jgi:hypothetical protein